MGRPHPIFHHIFPPNYKGKDDSDGGGIFFINSEGFRGKEYPIKKPEGTYRIVVLGDSYTFGQGVNDDETFSVSLEETLNSKLNNKKYEIINCGISSYSPLLEYLLLKDKAIKYSPDLVMLFYDFGDMEDDALRLKNALYDKNGELIACNPLYVNGHLDYVQIMRKNSRMFSYFYTKLSSALQKIRLLGLKEYVSCILQGKRARVAIRMKGNLKNIELDRYFMFRENKDREIIRHYWRNSEVWVDKINDLLYKRGIEFILVAYPYPIQVSPTAWQGGRAMWQFENNKLYDSPMPFEVFYEYSKKRKIKFINLWQHLLNYSSENLYYDWNGHWTPTGHKRVAEGIFNNPIFIDTLNKK